MVEAEVPVVGEGPGRRLVVLGTGHDVERQRLAVAPAQGHDLLGVDLEEAGRRDGADRVRPLGAVEPEPGPGAPGDQHHAHLARRQGRRAALGDVTPRHPLAVSLRQAVNLDRLDPLGVGDGRLFLAHEVRDQRVELVEVDALDFADQPRPLVIAEHAPPLQQVPLTVPGQAFDERRVGGHSQTLLPCLARFPTPSGRVRPARPRGGRGFRNPSRAHRRPKRPWGASWTRSGRGRSCARGGSGTPDPAAAAR